MVIWRWPSAAALRQGAREEMCCDSAVEGKWAGTGVCSPRRDRVRAGNKRSRNGDLLLGLLMR